jgi:hypothetical protein
LEKKTVLPLYWVHDFWKNPIRLPKFFPYMTSGVWNSDTQQYSSDLHLNSTLLYLLPTAASCLWAATTSSARRRSDFANSECRRLAAASSELWVSPATSVSLGKKTI